MTATLASSDLTWEGTVNLAVEVATMIHDRVFQPDPIAPLPELYGKRLEFDGKIWAQVQAWARDPVTNVAVPILSPSAEVAEKFAPPVCPHHGCDMEWRPGHVHNSDGDEITWDWVCPSENCCEKDIWYWRLYPKGPTAYGYQSCGCTPKGYCPEHIPF